MMVIYTDVQSSMQSIEYNKENHPILNQMYDILAELHEQDKKIILYKVPAHMGNKEYKKTDKLAKEAIDLPGMTTRRLPYTDYYPTIRRVRNSKWQREWENNYFKLHYIKPCIKEWESTHNICKQ